MAWNKNTLISTHTITQPMIDAILGMGPRGWEWLVLANSTIGDPGTIPEASDLVPVDATMAERLLERGPRAAHMAQILTGYRNPDGSVDGTGGIQIGLPFIAKDSETQYTLGGFWPPGTEIDFTATVKDPDGIEDIEAAVTVLPTEGAPEEGWSAMTAATVIAGDITALPHVRGEAFGSTITIATSDPDYTVCATDLVIA